MQRFNITPEEQGSVNDDEVPTTEQQEYENINDPTEARRRYDQNRRYNQEIYRRRRNTVL